MLTLEVPSIITDVFSVLTSAFTFITSNQLLGLLVGGAVGVALVGGLISLFVGRSR